MTEERILPFAEVQVGDKVRLERTSASGTLCQYTGTVTERSASLIFTGSDAYSITSGYTIVLLDRPTPRSLPALMLDAFYGDKSLPEWSLDYVTMVERALAVATPVIRQAVVAEIRAAIEAMRNPVTASDEWNPGRASTQIRDAILALPVLATEDKS